MTRQTHTHRYVFICVCVYIQTIGTYIYRILAQEQSVLKSFLQFSQGFHFFCQRAKVFFSDSTTQSQQHTHTEIHTHTHICIYVLYPASCACSLANKFFSFSALFAWQRFKFKSLVSKRQLSATLRTAKTFKSAINIQLKYKLIITN